MRLPDLRSARAVGPMLRLRGLERNIGGILVLDTDRVRGDLLIGRNTSIILIEFVFDIAGVALGVVLVLCLPVVRVYAVFIEFRVIDHEIAVADARGADRPTIPCGIHMEIVPVKQNQIPCVGLRRGLCVHADAFDTDLLQQEFIAIRISRADCGSIRESACGKVRVPLTHTVRHILDDPVMKFQDLRKISIIRLNQGHSLVIGRNGTFDEIQCPRRAVLNPHRCHFAVILIVKFRVGSVLKRNS